MSEAFAGGFLNPGQTDLSAYLTSATAASTYLTQADATTTYLPLTGGTLNGNLILNGGTLQVGGDTIKPKDNNHALSLESRMSASNTNPDLIITSDNGTVRDAGTKTCSFRNNNTEKLFITSDGMIGYVSSAGSTQLTVGAAGTASTLPAKPSFYAKFRKDAVTFVIPCYASS